LIWAAVCAGALLLPPGEGRKRENLCLLAASLGMAVDSILNHLALVRSVRPLSEEVE
jgi:hypothetical protein